MQIPRRILNLLNVAGDNSRYALDGVNFEAGPVAVATNGRVILAAAWKPESGQEAPAGLFYRETLDTAKKIAVATDKKCESILVEQKAAGNVTFPNWKMVVPRYNHLNSLTCRLTPETVSNLLTAINRTLLAGSEGWIELTIPSAPGKPILLVAGEVNEPASIVAVSTQCEPRKEEMKVMPQLQGIVAGEFYQKPCEAVTKPAPVAAPAAGATLPVKPSHTVSTSWPPASPMAAPVYEKDPAAVAINQTPVTAKNQRPSVKISAPAWMRLPAVYAQKAG